MGEIEKCSFEDIQSYINKKKANPMSNPNILLIHCLPSSIKNMIQFSLNSVDEVNKITENINNNNFNIIIILYGLNSNDTALVEKYNRLLEHGFERIYVYLGGLFEWLCLQDIYGSDEFPTTETDLDLFQYRPQRNISLTREIEQQGYYLHNVERNNHSNSNSGLLGILRNVFS